MLTWWMRRMEFCLKDCWWECLGRVDNLLIIGRVTCAGRLMLCSGNRESGGCQKTEEHRPVEPGVTWTCFICWTPERCMTRTAVFKSGHKTKGGTAQLIFCLVFNSGSSISVSSVQQTHTHTHTHVCQVSCSQSPHSQFPTLYIIGAACNHL